MNYEVREIPFAPGYFVSTNGEVFTERVKGHQSGTDKRGPRKLKKWSRGPGGYPTVSFRPFGQDRSVTLPVHRVVATVFLGQKELGQEVRHLDGDKLNADVSNLAWGSSLDNAMDRARHGTQLRGERAPGAKLTAEKVRAIRKDARPSRAVAIDHDVSSSLIDRVRWRKAWAHVS